MYKEDMDVVTNIFGARFIHRDTVEIYVEENGWYTLNLSFNKCLLTDLKSLVDQLLNHPKRGVDEVT